MKKVIIATSAKRDLDEIYDYFDAIDSDLSTQFAARVRSICKLLAKQPRLGRPRDKFYPGLRSFVIDSSYLLFFIASDTTVKILRVVLGTRDLGTIDWTE